jgi:hypothetical protein
MYPLVLADWCLWTQAALQAVQAVLDMEQEFNARLLRPMSLVTSRLANAVMHRNYSFVHTKRADNLIAFVIRLST